MTKAERAARADAAWARHLAGQSITLDEFIARHRGGPVMDYTGPISLLAMGLLVFVVGMRAAKREREARGRTP
jgi:hypothetical protein